MTYSDYPVHVRRLVEALSRKLGRPAACRKVKNGNSWYIIDPVWSHVQFGQRKGNTGYRIGLYVDLDAGSVSFSMVHSPIAAKRFREAASLDDVVAVARRLGPFRSRHVLLFSSRSESVDPRKVRRFEGDTAEELIAEIYRFNSRSDFMKDLFPTLPSAGTLGGKAQVAGNDFHLGLVNPLGKMRSRKDADFVVEAAWPLLRALYPDQPVTRRDAALRRSMVSRKVPVKCEISSIVFDQWPFSKRCVGRIEAAHIKPHALGGSDKAENGIWLCAFHHRKTEGLLGGSRKSQVVFREI